MQNFLLISTNGAYKSAPNVQKCGCNVYLFQHSFHFACRRWWLGSLRGGGDYRIHFSSLSVTDRLVRCRLVCTDMSYMYEYSNTGAAGMFQKKTLLLKSKMSLETAASIFPKWMEEEGGGGRGGGGGERRGKENCSNINQA